MTDSSPTAKLLKSDLDYLRRNNLVTPRIQVEIDRQTARHSHDQSVEIDRELANEIRSELATRVGLVGLDPQGRANEEGRYIEDMIDRLFLP